MLLRRILCGIYLLTLVGYYFCLEDPDGRGSMSALLLNVFILN